jgi:hypothetical protein
MMSSVGPVPSRHEDRYTCRQSTPATSQALYSREVAYVDVWRGGTVVLWVRYVAWLEIYPPAFKGMFMLMLLSRCPDAMLWKR